MKKMMMAALLAGLVSLGGSAMAADMTEIGRAHV